MAQEEEQFDMSTQISLMPTSTNLGKLTTTAVTIAGIMYTRALNKFIISLWSHWE